MFLECPQREFGQLTNDSFSSYFTQTDIHHQTTWRWVQGGRQELAHNDWAVAASSPRDGGGCYLRNVLGQGPCWCQNTAHRWASQGPWARTGEPREPGCALPLPSPAGKGREVHRPLPDFSSIPDLYPLNASSTPQLWKSKMSCLQTLIATWPLGAKSLLSENQ